MASDLPTIAVPTRDTPLLEAARLYLDLGLLPIPVYGIVEGGVCACEDGATCKAPGKHPVGARWQQRAPRTIDAARDLLAHHDGNLGACVAGTPFVVLDFDGEVGLNTLGELGLPRTLTARSGSGGAHLVYELDTRHDAAAISDRRVGPGWDVKKHGQFLVAPSQHLSGGFYEWTEPAPIAMLPDWLFERIKRPVAAVPPPSSTPATGDLVKRARAYIDRMPAAISGSRGHDATFAVARKLVQDFSLGEGEAWSLLLEYNQRCQPPWNEKELRHKLESAKKAHTRIPIADRPRLRAVPSSSSSSSSSSYVEGPPPAPPTPDWRSLLLWNESKNGRRKLVTHAENVIRILQLHPKWKGCIRYDEFSGKVLATDPPWDDFQRPTSSETQWSDEDETRLSAWLRREFHSYAFDVSDRTCGKAVDVVSRAHGFHPVREYLSALAWDQQPRLATIGPKFFGAASDRYTSNVFTWWLVSAVARVFRPGCKADHVLILEGKTGFRKSTALKVLAGEWFTDTPIDLNSKDAFGQIRGKWIVELAELDSLFKTTSSRAKAFFSSPRDDYRRAYGRREIEQLRQCVFAGTVNPNEYLRDPTGNRRFWPVRVMTTVRLDELAAARDQLWAEAVWRFQNGARWWPEGDEETEAAEQQDERLEEDAWVGRIRGYLKKAGDQVSREEVLGHALHLEPRDWTPSAATRVGIIMTSRLKWAKRRLWQNGERVWVYERPTSQPQLSNLGE